MRKIHIYSFLLVFFTAGITNCGDNTKFSELHNLTTEEQTELDRQDSIKEAQKNTINANLILYYDLDITISSTLYEGGSVAIETDVIAEAFDIAVETLLDGIAGESGAPEIKGFAIEGSTGADNSIMTNTNAAWGHWWSTEGDVSSWGDDAMVFTEFNTETGVFSVGQYPGHLIDGQTVTFIEALRYNEIRIAIVITVTAKAADKVTATIVNTQSLTIDVTQRSDYEMDSLKFDATRTLSDLEVPSFNDVKTIGVNADGSYAQESNGGNNGFWYGLDGFVGSWGDEACVYTSLETDDEGNYYIGIGQMPNVLTEGDTYNIQYGFTANNKIEMLDITINVVGYQDPETAPTGEPESIEMDITMTKAWDDTYNNVQIDIQNVLRNAFKMTTYQIYQAILSGELKIYMNEVLNESPEYTADNPGYWILADGRVGTWAESIVWCSLGHSETALYLYGGNHPDNAIAGDVVKTKMIIVCNSVEATFNITYTLTEAIEE